MGNGSAALAAELARALQLVTQLERSLPRSSTTESSCKALALEVRSSLQAAILIAKSNELDDRDQQQHATAVTPLKWTQQVRLIAGEGRVEELPFDDGHRWRKYGQKVILGAKHPRAYYRCTHRIKLGCPATKQVQQSDDDPLLFYVTYVETHSCLQGPRRGPASASEVQASSSSLPPPTLASMLVRNEHEMQPPPVNSESNYFSMSAYHALEESDIGIFGGGMELQNLDSDPATTTAAASQVHMDLMLDELDLLPDFEFDASSFFF